MEKQEILKEFIEKLRNIKGITDGTDCQNLIQKSFFDKKRELRTSILYSCARMIQLNGCRIIHEKRVSENFTDFELAMGDKKGIIRMSREVEAYKPSKNGQWGVCPSSFRFTSK